jgi:isopentenyl-diphosphate delta-isomerase
MEATTERVTLVDVHDRVIGAEEKLRAHMSGALHRAFSVVVCGRRGVLLQQRAATKYHSPLLWSNTCCGHPRPGEETLAAARRRLDEEMGIRCDLVPASEITYRIDMPSGLIEHEYNHIMLGRSSVAPTINVEEVARWCWIQPEALLRAVARTPHHFTPWFPLMLARLEFT